MKKSQSIVLLTSAAVAVTSTQARIAVCILHYGGRETIEKIIILF